MFETKTATAKACYVKGDVAGALRIAKDFKLGLTEDERRAIEISHECFAGKAAFYEMLGVDRKLTLQKAEDALKKLFS
jgi:hypothetical protein